MEDATRHKYDMNQDFDQLRREARIIEREYKLADKEEGQQKAQVKMAVTSEEETGVSSVRKLEGMVHKLGGEVHAIQKQIVGEDQNVDGREMKQPPDGYRQGLGAGYGRDEGRGDQWQPHPQMRPSGTSEAIWIFSTASRARIHISTSEASWSKSSGTLWTNSGCSVARRERLFQMSGAWSYPSRLPPTI